MKKTKSVHSANSIVRVTAFMIILIGILLVTVSGVMYARNMSLRSQASGFGPGGKTQPTPDPTRKAMVQTCSDQCRDEKLACQPACKAQASTCKTSCRSQITSCQQGCLDLPAAEQSACKKNCSSTAGSSCMASCQDSYLTCMKPCETNAKECMSVCLK